MAVIVADVADAMRDIEGGQLLAAAVCSAADGGQSRAVHPDFPAALLVGAGRRCLRVCRYRQADREDATNTPRATFIFASPLFDEAITVETRGKVLDNRMRASACDGGNA